VILGGELARPLHCRRREGGTAPGTLGAQALPRQSRLRSSPGLSSAAFVSAACRASGSIRRPATVAADLSAGGQIRWIRRTTIGCAGLLAVIAGTVSYLHMHELVALYGQRGRVAALTPLSVDGMIVTGADLRNADLRQADLTGAKFTRASLAGVLLAEAQLCYPRPDSCGSQRSQARQCLLQSVAAWGEINLSGRVRVLLRFPAGRLHERHPQKHQAARIGACAVGTARSRPDHGSMVRTSLSKTDLTGACLRWADLAKADITGARLKDTDLRDASICDAGPDRRPPSRHLPARDLRYRQRALDRLAELTAVAQRNTRPGRFLPMADSRHPDRRHRGRGHLTSGAAVSLPQKADLAIPYCMPYRLSRIIESARPGSLLRLRWPQP
jgi:hypothetical protein